MDIKSFWNFGDAAGSEQRFREAIPSGDFELDLQLRTQVARALGLQKRFDEARSELSAVEQALPDSVSRAHVRHALEMGRVERSSGSPEAARPLFDQALELAQMVGDDDLAVDAVHMIALVVQPAESLEWNLRAIAMADASTDQSARDWLGSLLNNTGWSLHDLERYGEALELFRRAEAFWRERSKPDRLHVAQWCVARCMRSLGQFEEALELQFALLAEDQSGYASEEIGECLLALGRRAESVEHFRTAAEKLAKDIWLVDAEPERIGRLKRLGEGKFDG